MAKVNKTPNCLAKGGASVLTGLLAITSEGGRGRYARGETATTAFGTEGADSSITVGLIALLGPVLSGRTGLAIGAGGPTKKVGTAT